MQVGTEALALNECFVRCAQIEPLDGTPTLVVELDVRKGNWQKRLGLPRGTQVYWDNVRTVDISEVSALLWPICYRVTIGDGWYRDAKGERQYFGVEAYLPGLDLKRRVTTVVLRAAVLLCVVGGVGLRAVCWLLAELFHVQVSKSALDRWIREAAAHLPDAEQMAQYLRAQKPVAEAHFDELFPRGRKHPVLVVRDEHGRILVAQEVEHRDAAHVIPFLEKLKAWGFRFERFYIDHCAAYVQAIQEVFPNAEIQYDYFHILQNAWKKVWRGFVAHRKEVKKRGAKVGTAWYAAKLEALAKRLWNKRGLIFTVEEHLTDEQRAKLNEIVAADPFVATLRQFLGRVRGIFTDAKGELGARQRLGRLKRFAEEHPEQPAFTKVVKFLDERFEQMITFLRVDGVRRNSLAETGMRTLRRLEQGHDGFRTAEARDCYLRLFQAIRYFGWSVYRHDGSLGLSPPAPS